MPPRSGPPPRPRGPPPSGTAAAGPPHRPRIVVVGDLVMDVVLAADRHLERGTDITGRVLMRQGGSAASTARWLGRIGARSTLVCSIGRDATGRALVAALAADGVTVRAVRVAGVRTGRIGVFVEAGGERSFVTDRGAALRLRPEDLRSAWFAGAEVVHLPAYSLLDQPLGRAGMVAIRLAREAGALVTVDLSSSGPLLAGGRRAALALVREAAPDILFATRDEAKALMGSKREEGLLDLAPIAVVKRGRKGAVILVRGEADRPPHRGPHHPGQGRGHHGRRRRVQRGLPGGLDPGTSQRPAATGGPAARRGRGQPARAPPPVEAAGRAVVPLSRWRCPCVARSASSSPVCWCCWS